MGLVTGDGEVLALPPSRQLVATDELGCPAYAGNRFEAADFAADERAQIAEEVRRCGQMLARQGFHGPFGIDFLRVDRSTRVYHDLNPRMNGAAGLLAEIVAGAEPGLGSALPAVLLSQVRLAAELPALEAGLAAAVALRPRWRWFLAARLRTRRTIEEVPPAGRWHIAPGGPVARWCDDGGALDDEHASLVVTLVGGVTLAAGERVVLGDLGCTPALGRALLAAHGERAGARGARGHVRCDMSGGTGVDLRGRQAALQAAAFNTARLPASAVVCDLSTDVIAAPGGGRARGGGGARRGGRGGCWAVARGWRPRSGARPRRWVATALVRPGLRVLCTEVYVTGRWSIARCGGELVDLSGETGGPGGLEGDRSGAGRGGAAARRCGVHLAVRAALSARAAGVAPGWQGATLAALAALRDRGRSPGADRARRVAAGRERRARRGGRGAGAAAPAGGGGSGGDVGPQGRRWGAARPGLRRGSGVDRSPAAGRGPAPWARWWPGPCGARGRSRGGCWGCWSRRRGAGERSTCWPAASSRRGVPLRGWGRRRVVPRRGGDAAAGAGRSAAGVELAGAAVSDDRRAWARYARRRARGADAAAVAARARAVAGAHAAGAHAGAGRLAGGAAARAGPDADALPGAARAGRRGGVGGLRGAGRGAADGRAGGARGLRTGQRCTPRCGPAWVCRTRTRCSPRSGRGSA
jgi:hypothetical protein